MSEGKEVVGRIKINLFERGAPEVIIEGRIPLGNMGRMPAIIKKAYRIHVAKLNKAKRTVDMSDKGPTVADMKENPEPQPENPDSIQLPPQLDRQPVREQFEVPNEEEQANNPEKSEELENGTDSRTEEVHRDDEESGSKGSPEWQK